MDCFYNPFLLELSISHGHVQNCDGVGKSQGLSIICSKRPPGQYWPWTHLVATTLPFTTARHWNWRLPCECDCSSPTLLQACCFPGVLPDLRTVFLTPTTHRPCPIFYPSQTLNFFPLSHYLFWRTSSFPRGLQVLKAKSIGLNKHVLFFI